MARRPSNLKELELIAKDEWAKIPVETCKKLRQGQRVTASWFNNLCVQSVVGKCTLPHMHAIRPDLFAVMFVVMKMVYNFSNKNSERLAEENVSPSLM
ncbi:hypothetical protein QTP70_011808 [Hemibagrus guttatus]|uniref:Uncharacterized protein n=1 Tax=Hemibagrus guttatus TaxID=175788 RepID=A0AAE0QN60_9TELE|nr:hypothetical protein QTP70_011808 [Hemibagrus guttatus]